MHIMVVTDRESDGGMMEIRDGTVDRKSDDNDGRMLICSQEPSSY